MTIHYPVLDEVVRRDPRYTYEAYEFLFQALKHTQQILGREAAAEAAADEEHHVTGPELLRGVRDLALREFGLMARTVFRMWGITATADVGELVFNLIEAGLMSRTEDDDRRDFVDVYDLDEALSDYRIELPDEAEELP
jgi:uncharacterized repeat protein (TIGR04138 family)